MTDVERCPNCRGVIAIIGRSHLCRPVPVAGPTEGLHGCAVDLGDKAPPPPAAKTELVTKKASTTYDHRNPEQRRAYQRELMRKRRAKT